MQSLELKLKYKTIFFLMSILGQLSLGFRLSQQSIVESLLSFQIVLVTVTIKIMYDYYTKEFNL